MSGRTRRGLLRVVGAAGIGGIAGCSSSESEETPAGGEATTVNETETQAETETQTKTETGSQLTFTDGAEVVFQDGFEDGLDNWENIVFAPGEPFQVISPPSDDVEKQYQGSQVAYAAPDKNTIRTIAEKSLSEPRQLSRFQYAWYENRASFGGGVQLLNENDDVEIGVATDNPQWIVDTGSGRTQMYDGSGYDEWIETKLNFDWERSAVRVQLTVAESNIQTAQVYDLKEGENIETIRLQAFTSNRGWQNSSVYMAWDDFVATV